jgi:hypothetical protein
MSFLRGNAWIAKGERRQRIDKRELTPSFPDNKRAARQHLLLR